MNFKSLKNIALTLSKYTNIVFCGYSQTNLDIIKTYQLENKVSYIFDNNAKNINSKVSNIPIVDFEFLKSLSNYTIVLCGNHISSFYTQLRKLHFDKIIIDKQHLFTMLESFQTNLNVQIPDFIHNQGLDSSHTFISQLLKALLNLNRPITTQPTEHNNKEYFKKVLVKSNNIYFLYHKINYSENINVIIWKEGYLANMVTFDKKGYSGWSSLCDKNMDKLLENISQKKANKFFKKISTEYIQSNSSKYIQQTNTTFIFPKEFIFFPLQTLNDSVMLHSYFEPIKLIKKIVKILYKQNITLIIKKHPRCNNEELKELLLKYEKQKKIILFNGSIHDAISKATTIYTINSGVGFETLLHLKPVITFGKSDYMSMTKNINNLDIIKNNPFYKLERKDKINIKKFIYYYINKKCLFLNDTDKLDKIITKFIINYLNMKKV